MIAEVSQYVAVASFMEAWIETAKRVFIRYPLPVASFMEAWIETKTERTEIRHRRCRLLHGGVDWNQGRYDIGSEGKSSPPSWRRGLKPSVYRTRKLSGDEVASFMEAWIETLLENEYAKIDSVASFMEAWIETGNENGRTKRRNRRLLHGGVDWNTEQLKEGRLTFRSPPSWRRGLKLLMLYLTPPDLVASFMEAWIET